DHIWPLLSRDQSIPYLTISTSSTNIFDFDLEKNLSQFIKILTEQDIDKQKKMRKEIENKQLTEEFQQIQKQF
ncbi:unnamed protein product, partial [Rotaria sp. Silwood2]